MRAKLSRMLSVIPHCAVFNARGTSGSKKSSTNIFSCQRSDEVRGEKGKENRAKKNRAKQHREAKKIVAWKIKDKGEATIQLS